MRILPLALAALLTPAAAFAQCGGSFSNFVSGLKQEAVTAGYETGTVNAFFKGARQDPKVLKADRAQGVAVGEPLKAALAVVEVGGEVQPVHGWQL